MKRLSDVWIIVWLIEYHTFLLMIIRNMLFTGDNEEEQLLFVPDAVITTIRLLLPHVIRSPMHDPSGHTWPLDGHRIPGDIWHPLAKRAFKS